MKLNETNEHDVMIRIIDTYEKIVLGNYVERGKADNLLKIIEDYSSYHYKVLNIKE